MGSRSAVAGGRAASAGSSTSTLIRMSMAIFVLLQSPAFTFRVTDQATGARLDKHVSPLEVAAIGAIEVEPSSRPFMQAALLTGTALKEMAKVAAACYMHGLAHKDCTAWSQAMQFSHLWSQSDITPQMQQQWHTAVAQHHTLLTAACAVVAIGGIACFVTTVKMVPVGLFLLVSVVAMTPNCRMLPNLGFMCFLGIMMLLGDPAPRSHKPSKTATPGGAAASAKSQPGQSRQGTSSKGTKPAAERNKARKA